MLMLQAVNPEQWAERSLICGFVDACDTFYMTSVVCYPLHCSQTGQWTLDINDN